MAVVWNTYNSLSSPVQLIIIVPSDFSNVASSGSNTGWDPANIQNNPDGSVMITVQTTSSQFNKDTDLTYQFTADAPSVDDKELYVFQTTAIYPSWNSGDKVQIASALSEAGVQVIP